MDALVLGSTLCGWKLAAQLPEAVAGWNSGTVNDARVKVLNSEISQRGRQAGAMSPSALVLRTELLKIARKPQAKLRQIEILSTHFHMFPFKR